MIQAPAHVEGNRVEVETPSGVVAFDVADFLAVVPGGCPAREWPSRLDQARRGDAPSRFAELWWALQNGLIPETVAALREFAKRDPDYAPTAGLAAALNRLDRPKADPDVTRLRTALGVPCRELQGSYVLLLHQHDDVDARARLGLLENVVVAYHLWLAGHGIDVKMPSERLVSMYLADRSDYLAFLNSQNAGAFRATLGYFHPNFKAVVCYDARWKDHAHADTGADSRRQSVLHECDALARDHGTAAHELIHLLVTETGLEPRPGAFPHWLHEGLAAQFEVVRGGRWAGIGRAHDLRLPDVRNLNGPLSLPDLVRDAGFGHGYRRDLYARSWALVYFLRQSHPDDFANFLDLLRTPDPSSASVPSGRVETTFQTAFSADLAVLESEWRSFLNGVRTPLEAHAPSRVTQ
jgi:Protein of unknown function (DUF1570)